MFKFCFLQVTISQITYTEKTGHYELKFRKPLTSGTNLVEVSAIIPDNQDYLPAAKAVREFADQLSPLVELQKFDYTKDNWSFLFIYFMPQQINDILTT